jgi:hypothetical protein
MMSRSDVSPTPISPKGITWDGNIVDEVGADSFSDKEERLVGGMSERDVVAQARYLPTE